MENTAGQKIDENLPVIGCEGCNTTAGRMGCSKHNGIWPHNDWSKCKKCGYGLAYRWYYCPSCGTEVIR